MGKSSQKTARRRRKRKEQEAGGGTTGESPSKGHQGNEGGKTGRAGGRVQMRHGGEGAQAVRVLTPAAKRQRVQVVQSPHTPAATAEALVYRTPGGSRGENEADDDFLSPQASRVKGMKKKEEDWSVESKRQQRARKRAELEALEAELEAQQQQQEAGEEAGTGEGGSVLPLEDSAAKRRQAKLAKKLESKAKAIARRVEALNKKELAAAAEEAQALAASTYFGAYKKAYTDAQVEKYGGKVEKTQAPLRVMVGMKRKEGEREAKRLQRAKELGIHVAQSKNARNKARDRRKDAKRDTGLRIATGTWKKGVLVLKKKTK